MPNKITKTEFEKIRTLLLEISDRLSLIKVIAMEYDDISIQPLAIVIMSLLTFLHEVRKTMGQTLPSDDQKYEEVLRKYRILENLNKHPWP